MTADRFRGFADKLRLALGIPDDVNLDPLDVLIRAEIAGLIKGHRFIRDQSLSNEEAYWDRESGLINLRKSLEARLASKDRQARFTVFHELAHAFLGHTKRNRMPSGRTQFGRYVDSDERDADELAMHFAAPLEVALSLRLETPEDIAAVFGLPPLYTGAHLVRLEKLRRQLENSEVGGIQEYDNYEEAMRLMARNARNWNR